MGAGGGVSGPPPPRSVAVVCVCVLEFMKTFDFYNKCVMYVRHCGVFYMILVFNLDSASRNCNFHEGLIQFIVLYCIVLYCIVLKKGDNFTGKITR